MVPEEFHDFFVASAGVAGALIGLLFVAISVHPEQIADDGDAAMRFRPSSALSALLNALFVSLLMLIPGIRAAPGVIAVGISGLVAVATLFLSLVRQRRRLSRWAMLRSVVLLVGQGAVYSFEISLSVQLRRGVEPTPLVQSLCVLVLVLFAMGIERAWEFVGASMPGLLSSLFSLGRKAGDKKT